MSIFFRIWLTFTLLIIIGSGFLLYEANKQFKPNAKQIMEEILADNANIISALIADDVAQNRVQQPEFHQRIESVMARVLQGQIWSFNKASVQQKLYITDNNGIVIYDSENKNIGKDFSQWNDVYLTLKGQYGVRSSLDENNPKNGSIMYVAAPIIDHNELIGVVSLAKPSISVEAYIKAAEQKMLKLVLFYSLIVWLVCALLSWHLSKNIDAVRRYALSLAPKQWRPKFYMAKELNQLTDSIANMRQQLEDQAYVEQYVVTLTHELKSPLAGIKASAEILQDQLPFEDQRHFAENIEQQSENLHQLVERLLLLMRLEKQQSQPDWQLVDLNALLNQLQQAIISKLEQKNISIKSNIIDIQLVADPFWLKQALNNILDNAIAFADPNSTIEINIKQQGQYVLIQIDNQGQQIPEFALSQIFERYFSLPRQTTGKKSTGIGLTLVAEVIKLHSGTINICNTDHGVLVEMLIPLSPAS